MSQCLSVHLLHCACPAAAQRVERVEHQSTQEGDAAEENNEITEGRRLNSFISVELWDFWWSHHTCVYNVL